MLFERWLKYDLQSEVNSFAVLIDLIEYNVYINPILIIMHSNTSGKPFIRLIKCQIWQIKIFFFFLNSHLQLYIICFFAHFHTWSIDYIAPTDYTKKTNIHFILYIQITKAYIYFFPPERNLEHFQNHCQLYFISRLCNGAVF